jgi:hypothetical protein
MTSKCAFIRSHRDALVVESFRAVHSADMAPG